MSERNVLMGSFSKCEHRGEDTASAAVTMDDLQLRKILCSRLLPYSGTWLQASSPTREIIQCLPTPLTHVWHFLCILVKRAGKDLNTMIIFRARLAWYYRYQSDFIDGDHDADETFKLSQAHVHCPPAL